MLKYCNGCERDLEIDKFYSYEKSTCKECVNRKVKCDFCDKEFNSTNLSKHIKQIHSTLLGSDKSDSTLQGSDKSDSTLLRSDKCDSTLLRSDKSDSTLLRSDKSNSTLQRSDKNNEPLYPTIEDGLYLNKYIELEKDKIYDTKTRDKLNRILTKNRILCDKIKKTITKREENQYENNLNKLRDLNYFDERVCKILLKYKYID